MTTMARTLMKGPGTVDDTHRTGTAGLRDTGASAGPRDEAAEVLRLFAADGLPLYRFCRSILRTPGDAEDIVQDTFIKLLQHLRSGGDRSNLRAWLFAVAANACRDRSRWGMRWLPWRPELDRRTVAAVEPAGFSARAGFSQNDPPQHERARAALNRLAPRDRLLLSLRAQGLSYRDMSVATGIAEKSVGRLLARAVGRWKQHVSKYTEAL